MRPRTALKALCITLAALGVVIPITAASANATRHQEATTTWRQPHTVPIVMMRPVLPPPMPTPDEHEVLMSWRFRLTVFVNAVTAWRITEAAALSQLHDAAVLSSSGTARSGETSPTSYTTAAPAVSSDSSGYLPGPIWACIARTESSDTPTDHSGAYGDLDSTWAGYDGYPYAGAAPLSVQNAFNAALQARDGWSPWNDSCFGR